MKIIEYKSTELTKEIAEHLARIDKICFPIDAWTKKDWIELFDKQPTTSSIQVFLGYDDKCETPIAAAVWQKIQFAQTGYFISNAVLPEYRGKGYGEALLITRITEAKKLHIKFLFAHTRISNGTSQKLLLYYGFKPNSIVSHYYLDEDAIEWKKEL